RVEWGVKVYVEDETPPAPAEPAPKPASGRDYLRQRRMQTKSREDRWGKAETFAARLHESLREHAEDSRLHAPQNPTLSGAPDLGWSGASRCTWRTRRRRRRPSPRRSPPRAGTTCGSAACRRSPGRTGGERPRPSRPGCTSPCGNTPRTPGCTHRRIPPCPAPPGAMCSTRPIWCRAHSPRHSWKGWKGRRTVCPEFAWNSPDRGPPIRSPVRNPLWGRGRDRRRTPGDRPGGPARPAAGRRGRHHRRHHPAHRGRGSRPDRSERAHQLGQRERPVTLRGAALTGPPHDEHHGGRPHRGRRHRMDLEPDTVERDLVKLVLTVVELLRQLM